LKREYTRAYFLISFIASHRKRRLVIFNLMKTLLYGKQTRNDGKANPNLAPLMQGAMFGLDVLVGPGLCRSCLVPDQLG
jgi:hypothetical protein